MRKIILLMFLLCASLTSAQLPEGYSMETLNLEFDNPMDIEFITVANQFEYMVVAERAGKVWICDLVENEWVKRDEPVIDITNQVTTYFERGVQSIAVNTAYIYMYYTVEESYLFPELNLPVNDDSATINRVSGWEISWLQNISFEEEILIGTTPSDGIPSTAGNHNGGGLVLFASSIFVSTGDGASGVYNDEAIERGIIRPEEDLTGSFKPQLLNGLNGKVLRVLNFNGDASTINPFYDAENPRSAESRVWAMGFRNAFEMTKGPNNNSWIVADVGAGQYEEITVIDKKGLNAGWGFNEGFRANNLNPSFINPDEGVPFASLITQSTSFIDDNDVTQRRFKHHVPELDYGHNGNFQTRLPRFTNGSLDPIIDNNPIEGNSITGGTLISGNGFGSQYNGAYIFTDFTRGWLNIALPNNDVVNNRYFSNTINFGPDDTLPNPVDITQGLDNNIYVVNLFGDINVISFDETLSIPFISEKDEINIMFDSNTYLNTIYGIEDKATLLIYDSLGRFISSDEIYNYHIIDDTLASGIYIASITIEDKTITKKFIIK